MFIIKETSIVAEVGESEMFSTVLVGLEISSSDTGSHDGI